MLYFFDESGDFQLPPPGEHRCAVVCGVVIPETIADSLRSDLAAFTGNLSAAEKQNGEPKGQLLKDKSRFAFCRMVNRYRQLLIIPATLDLSESTLPGLGEIGQRMRDVLYEGGEQCLYDSMREDMRELGRQWANMSPNQSMRILTLSYAVRMAMQYSLIALANPIHDTCWGKLSFFIDAVHARRMSREERVFSIMVLSWLSAWSTHDPINLVKEIHTDDHPYVRNFCTPAGVDLGKVLRGNIHYVDSAKSWGIRLADISSNIVYQAVHDLSNYDERLVPFRHLMANCPYGPAVGGPGLIVAARGFGGSPAPKYHLLHQVMHPRRE